MALRLRIRPLFPWGESGLSLTLHHTRRHRRGKCRFHRSAGYFLDQASLKASPSNCVTGDSDQYHVCSCGVVKSHTVDTPCIRIHLSAQFPIVLQSCDAMGAEFH